MIISTANQKVKRILKLQKKAKARNEEHVFLVEGIRLTREAPKERLLELYISETFLQKHPGLDDRLLRRAEVVSDEVFAHMSDTKTPQGILAVIRREDARLESLFEKGTARSRF